MSYPFPAPNGYEEALNQQFAGFLSYSLHSGPELLNRMHENQSLIFSDEARIVADQDSPLPKYTETGKDREIDWVICDEDSLVGYESKYGDSLKRRQLRDELAKLELNAEGRETKLVAVTPHTTRPSVVDEFDEDTVYWLSWVTVARRLQQTDETNLLPEQRPLLRMLQDLLTTEDMHPFTGFNHHDKQQYRYFIRDLRQELVNTELENRGDVHTWTTTNPNPASYKRLVPRYLDVPFVSQFRDEESGTKRGSSLAVLVDTETHAVHTGVVFNVQEIESHETFVEDNVDTLVSYAAENDLKLWASMNSPNQWELGVAKTDTPDEMRTWLEEGTAAEITVDNTGYKKARFVRECSASDPARIVEDTKSDLLSFYEEILMSDRVYPRSTLAEQE